MREYLLIFLWFFLVSLPAQPLLITYLEMEQDLFFQTLFRAAGARDSSGNDHRNTGVYDPHPDCTSALVDLVG